jgi:hypothetical protein
LNQDSNGRSNPLDFFIKTAPLCAAVIYGVLFIGYRTYYNELGINPEDVGVGSTFVLVRSIGYIALAVAAVAVVAAIVGVLEKMQKMREEEEQARKDKKAQGITIQEITLRQWLRHPSKFIPWLEQQMPYTPWTVLFVFLAAVLMGYLLALKPWSWPILWIAVIWVVLVVLAWIVERVSPKRVVAVGVFISILIAVVVPMIFIDFRAHDLADSALKVDALKGTVVKPYSILLGIIPVLDVSSDDVDIQWICSDSDKKRPSVFDGRDTSTGELLGENPLNLFVRMDPEGKTPIVTLPAECVVITRYKDIPAAHR